MSIFGIAKKGFGKAVKSYKQKKIASGKATRSDRIKYGERSPDIKSVPMSKTAKKNITESVRRGQQHFYLKNIDEVNKHNKTIREGEKAVSHAKKKLKKMTETKRAFHIGESIHPSNPAKGNK